MFDKRYPPLDPRSHSPGSPAAQAMEAKVQARQAGARPGAGPVPPLTAEQEAALRRESADASFATTNMRMQLEGLRRERVRGGLLSHEGQRTENALREVFDSASDGATDAVDARLRPIERTLRAPPPGYYRSFTSAESALHLKDLAKGGRGYAALQNPEHLSNTVAVNYPAYSRGSKGYQQETLVHETGHVHGPRLAEGEDLRTEDALAKAKQPGGTQWAIDRSPESLAVFVSGRRPSPLLPLRRVPGIE